jgi:hypothetical protein
MVCGFGKNLWVGCGRNQISIHSSTRPTHRPGYISMESLIKGDCSTTTSGRNGYAWMRGLLVNRWVSDEGTTLANR